MVMPMMTTSKSADARMETTLMNLDIHFRHFDDNAELNPSLQDPQSGPS